MQLRNGKTVVTELDTSLTSNEKSINYLIGKIINICNECSPLHSSYHSSIIHLFIEETRLLREIYYLIEYYGLHNNKNPKFEKFQICFKEKTTEVINNIGCKLKKGIFRMISEKDLKNVNELLYEMYKMI